MSDRTWMEHGTVLQDGREFNYVVVRRPSPDARPLYDVHLAGDRFKVRLLVLTGFLTCTCHVEGCSHRSAVMDALGNRSKRHAAEARERLGQQARKQWGMIP